MDIIVPHLTVPTLRERKRWSPTEGRGAIVHPDGTHEWVGGGDWIEAEYPSGRGPLWVANALHDAGELSMLNVYLKEQANVLKYLALLNDASLAETDGHMGSVTETQVPAANGYNRQAILNTDWTDDGLIGGDARFSAAEKTFGAASATWTLIAASLCTHLTLQNATAVLLLTIALAGTTTILSTQSFKHQLRWAQS